jgi:glutamine synthetase
LLDALRMFNRNKEFKSALGEEFSAAYLKLKHQEWDRFSAHFSQWEKDNTLDI